MDHDVWIFCSILKYTYIPMEYRVVQSILDIGWRFNELCECSSGTHYRVQITGINMSYVK